MKKIEIEWQGETLTIGEDQCFELAEEVEEVITLVDLSEIIKRPKLTKMARAYSVMINFAGGESTPAEVHKSMMQQLRNVPDEDGERRIIASDALNALVMIIMGGAPEEGVDATEKKPRDKSRRKRVRS